MNFNTPTTAALSRTWQTVTTYTACGENWGRSVDTVTLSRAFVGGPLLATINGEEVELSRAVRLLQDADTQPTVTAEVLPTEPPTIGKRRAAKLHKIMGRLGLPNFQHYGLAAAALCEPFPLDSLATLTEQEARRVWAHLCKLFPSARQYAA